MSSIENEIKELERQLQEKKELQEKIKLAGNNEGILMLQNKYLEVKVNQRLEYYGSEKYKELDKELSKIQKQIEELYSEDKKLAIFLHNKLCGHNHTDGCGWYYEIKDGLHEWNDYTHESYLKYAKRILEVIDYNTAIKVFSVSRY